MAIRIELVDEDGSLLTPVSGPVALTIPLEIQEADATSAIHRLLPDPGVHGSPFPLDVARKSNVHRYQSSHVSPDSSRLGLTSRDRKRAVVSCRRSHGQDAVSARSRRATRLLRSDHGV